MLYLLTIADVRAVGSEVWTTWKASLFHELFDKTFAVLDRGGFQQEASSERVTSMIRKVTNILEHDFPVADIDNELKAMPVRLLLSNPPSLIAEQVRLLLGLEQSDILLRLTHQPESGYSEYTICTHDMPGLFSWITGVMAANGINILGAQINTSKNGKVLDILQVNSPKGKLVTAATQWEKIEHDMLATLRGQIQVSTLVAKRNRPTLLTSRPAPRFMTKVDIDNEVSEDYTVIDVLAHDKVGLLYLITSTLAEMGLYIAVSKISTKVDQVADVFYVRDIFNHKITAPEKLDEICRKLMTSIDEWV